MIQVLTRADPGPLSLSPSAEWRWLWVARSGRPIADWRCRCRCQSQCQSQCQSRCRCWCRCLTQLSKALNYGRTGCQLNEQHVAPMLPTQSQAEKKRGGVKLRSRRVELNGGEGGGGGGCCCCCSFRGAIAFDLVWLNHGIDPQSALPLSVRLSVRLSVCPSVV